jgi:hypothetical protein
MQYISSSTKKINNVVSSRTITPRSSEYYTHTVTILLLTVSATNPRRNSNDRALSFATRQKSNAILTLAKSFYNLKLYNNEHVSAVSRYNTTGKSTALIQTRCVALNSTIAYTAGMDTEWTGGWTPEA